MLARRLCAACSLPRILLTVLFLFAARSILQASLDNFYGAVFEPDQLHRKLLQVHVVFKHGHRAPFRLYETDPNPIELWEEGLGSLTKLGRLQMYVLGTHLRERYSELLSGDPNQVYAQSSDAFRSLYSAYSFLAGFCQPSEEWAFTPDLPWQPVEVQYVPEEEEKYLQSNPNCPSYEASRKRSANSEEMRTFERNHQWLFEFWRNHSGKRMSSSSGAGDLFKTLSVERDMNLIIPDWAFEYWDELVHQADVHYYFNFKTRLQQRLRAGPLLGLILDRMDAAITGRMDRVKAYLYSGHGSNVAALQCALQSYDMRHSPHGAALVQELYREGDGSHSTRFLFFNSSHPEKFMEPALALHLHGCYSQFCPLETYRGLIRDLVPEDWKEECKESEEFPEDFTPYQYPDMVPLSRASATRNGLTATLLLLLCLALWTSDASVYFK